MPQVTPDPLTIRPAAVADAPALFELRREALRNHPEAFSSDQAREDARGVAFWAQRIEDAAQSVIFVATAGADLVAMTGVYQESQAKLNHIANVWGVYVQPEYRGRGVATELLDAGIAWARERDVLLVKLAVVTTNIAGIRCYTRAGFRVYGVEPKALRYNGVFYDELLMALEL